MSATTSAHSAGCANGLAPAPPSSGSGAAPEPALDQQTRVRIALYLARRGRGGMAPRALYGCGRAAGMNGAEMAANEAGTSHDAKGTACLGFVRALLDDARAPTPLDLQRMQEVGYQRAEIAAVIDQVGSTPEGVPVIDSPGETVNCASLNTRHAPAA